MKSFFKKLAFVMALAMVVTLAAPAAANAATALAAAHQISKEVVTELKMEVDDEVDLCFLGAQGGKAVWGKLNRGWKVTSGDAVTVDQNGLVKAVKNGEATIEFFMEGYTSAVVDITVGAEEVEVYGGYAQTKLNEVQFKFNVASIKESEVALYRVFSNTVDPNGTEVYWPIDGFSFKDGVMKVSPFVSFGDGDVYRIKYAGETYEFVTVKPTLEEVQKNGYVETLYGTFEVGDNLAFVTDEEATTAATVTLGYKLIYNGIDVTDLFKNSDEIQVEYELVSPDVENQEELTVDLDYEGYVTFYADVNAYVRAVVTTGTDDDGNDLTIASPGTEIDPGQIPEYKFNRVVKWSFYKSGDFAWDVHSIPADETGYRVVLMLEDSYGNVFVTDAVAADADNDIYVVDGSAFEAATYRFTYQSTNTDTFLIDPVTAEVKTYKEAAKAAFYVTLWKVNDEGENKVVDNVYAGVFSIGAPKKFTSLDPSKTSVTLMADADPNATTLYKADVVITPKHQYNNGTWEDNAGALEYDITCNNEKIKDKSGFTVKENGKGVITITLNGFEMYSLTKKTSFTITVTEKNTGVKTSFTVALNKPDWRDTTNSEKIDKNFIAGQLVDYTKDPIYTYDIFAEDGVTVIDTKEHYLNEILIDPNLTSKKYDKILVEATGNQTGFISGEDCNANMAITKTAVIDVYRTSNGYSVENHKTGEWIRATEGWKDATGYEPGTRIYALLKDGKEVAALPNGIYTIENNNNGTFEIQLVSGDAELTYAATGTYTFAVYTIFKVDANGKIQKNGYTTESDTFAFKATKKDLTLDERIEFETTKTDLKDIVIECFSFKLGSSKWVPTASVIDDVAVVEQTGGYTIIESVTFFVPVDGSKELTTGCSCAYDGNKHKCTAGEHNDEGGKDGNNCVATEDYYKVVIPVGMSVKHVTE